MKYTIRKLTLLVGAIVICITINAQNSWDKTGNLISTGDFIGTTNNQDLVFKANGVEGMRLRTNNTIFYDSKVVYNSTFKLKEFKNQGANYDRIVAVDKVGNIKLGVNTKTQNLTVFDNFTATSGVTFSDGTVQTTAASGGGASLWSTNINGIKYSGGNVAIGTDNASAKFNVKGTEHISHFYYGTNEDTYIRPGKSSGNVIMDYGNIGIGTSTIPTGYKLAVKGKIISEGVLVKLHADWPDYVFGEKYAMKTLPEVEAFINENKHLPNVPSEKEVAADGINLGEMDAILLQKIEELTLYTIDQQKMIKEQKEISKKQQKLIEKQGELIKQLATDKK